jgi:hypothetical protein
LRVQIGISRGRASGPIDGNAEFELKTKGGLIWNQIIAEERAAGKVRIYPHNRQRLLSNSTSSLLKADVD